jgi:CelD/BcsL family acetyltransferase involved in cellulose biosynthesis
VTMPLVEAGRSFRLRLKLRRTTVALAEVVTPRQAGREGPPDSVETGAASEVTRIECIQDPSGLAPLRAHWDELLRASAVSNPFLTFEWLHAWWMHLRGNAALHAIAAWSEERLIAVAPLMSGRALGWFPRLEFLGTGHAGSDYLDVIARRGHEAAAIEAMGDYIAGEQCTLRLDRLPDGSLASRLAARLHGWGWTTSTVPNGVCPIIDLRGHTWDSYLQTRGSAHRANVRRRLRALDEQLRPTFERVTTDAERREALSALFRFHEWRFRTRGGSTAFLTPALRAFHEDATRQALERGWLRMYVLRVDGAPASVMYGFGYDGQFYFYQHGFDDRYRRNSIGLALMALTVRAAIDEGMHTFDMLWGAEPYKWLWATGDRRLHQIHVFPALFRGWLSRRAVEVRRRLVPLTRRVLFLGASR